MKSLLLAILIVSFSVPAFAKDPILTCTIQNVKTKQKASVKLNLNKIAEYSGEYSKGIDSGKDNYSFGLEVTKSGKDYDLNIVFQENNHVEDEVGSIACTYNAKIGTRSFCYEPLKTSSDWTVAQFWCQVK
jgi:hypothetical protein